MEKTIIMDAAATVEQAGPAATPAWPAPRARRPYEAPGLEAVDLGRVLAKNEGTFVYSLDDADLPDVGGSGLGLSD